MNTPPILFLPTDPVVLHKFERCYEQLQKSISEVGELRESHTHLYAYAKCPNYRAAYHVARLMEMLRAFGHVRRYDFLLRSKDEGPFVLEDCELAYDVLAIAVESGFDGMPEEIADEQLVA